MFYAMANVDDFVGLADLGWSVSTPYGTLSPTKKVDLKNCQDLFARAQENFNLAAKHDSNFATYQKNMNLRYSQYQKCATAAGQTVYPLDTTADPTAIPTDQVPGAPNPVAPPPSALQYAAAVAGGVLTPSGTVPTPSAVQAQQAAASMTAPADESFFSSNTLIALGLGVAALAALIVLMKKSYPSSGSAPTKLPGVKV
jgi:hypothetical protein